ncbi:uncharacterized protein LOC126557676 [Anopheles maculipalpis]|uniref:uncharacterized protein LOC126557676 n=1 Tax=Anopheles maculipalpis TaxID=1496333 RepID=UPI0021594E88|nr:uncharacterized protein LOC126557676 [Anopheles maculipalpis]
MKLLWCFSVCLYQQALAVYREREVIQYVTNVTRVLAAQRTGSLVCWTLQFSKQHSAELLFNALVQALSVGEHKTILQADHTITYDASHHVPNMVAITLDVLDEVVNVENIYTWLQAIPVECFVILLFKQTNIDLIVPIANTFETKAIVNFIMIAVNVDCLYTFHNMPPRAVALTGFPTPEAIVYDRLKDINLGELSASCARDVYTYPFGETVADGEDIQLFKLFFHRLGMKLSIKPLNCKPLESYVQCLNDQTDTAIFINRFMPHRYENLLVDAIEMYKYGLYVPNGRLLTIMEIFLLPFDISVWGLVGLLCATFCILHRLAPNLYQNNLILLAIFGWEKRSLHRSDRCEKLSAIALIILFFQLTCVYETIIISSMINRPIKRTPKTIQEFLNTNAKVLFDSKVLDIQPFNMNIREMDIRSKDYRLEDSDNAAKLGNMLSLELAAMDAMNIDQATGRPQHVVVQETLLESMAFYYFREKSIFAKRFARFRRLVFEAGLQHCWRKELKLYNMRKQQMIYHAMNNQEKDFLKLEKIAPVFK